ncbi:hypothetical protein AMAG_13036 [Allomyces macrogynus ATCC 38327]|uniref:CS domain-containing protein n=1 Tax=Allomyces macrogynus (strain ATCC 38327) TaxID=578462 RepID=A0A0L0T141_ALLM3|nr:hypothetical protein AMAG_13036 [Allomyces macrogynus ATCC 38327]|eukprot:KNE68380.1 hypothetical protein AMAG_13036 [Allomyces macrogynus ATCC 38327]
MMLGTSSDHPATPTVLWAQRATHLLVTIEVHDCEHPTVTIDAKQVVFSAKASSTGAGSDKKHYRATLDLLHEIDPKASLYNIRPRLVEFVLYKKEEKWWPRLLSTKGKPFWLKTDFAKWKDEDESDEDEDEERKKSPGELLDQFNLSSGAMGGMGGMMGGMGGGMPDFASMAAAQGMKFESGASDEDDSDDEEMPPLVDQP